MTARAALAFAVLPGLVLVAGGPARAAVAPTVVVQDGLLVTAGPHGQLTVREGITFAHPLAAPLQLPEFPQAAHPIVSATPVGGRWERGQVVLAPGTRAVRLSYTLPLAEGSGLAAARTWPVPIMQQLVFAAPAVRFPIILNQRFFGQKGISIAGQSYQVYATQAPLAAGQPQLFNFQAASAGLLQTLPPAPTGRPVPLQATMAIGYGAALAAGAAYVAWRRRQRLSR